MSIVWEEKESVLIGCTPNYCEKKYSAGYDYDGTLGKYSPKSDKCELMYDKNKMTRILKKRSEVNSINIISNQLKLSSGDNKKKFKSKIQDLYDQLGVEFKIYVPFKKDIYRKPSIGLLKLGLNISSYCGDFAGRMYEHGKRDKDNTDIKFAKNLNIDFYTPEQVFVEDTDYKFPKKIDYINFDELKGSNKLSYFFIAQSKQEMIINTGCQGSGKSYFTNKYLVPFGYVQISNDIHKTKAFKICETILKEGKSVVIDNTNPDVASRSKYIKLAQKYNISVKSLYFNTDEKVAKHNNHYRSFTKNIKLIPDIAYRVYKKKFVMPLKKEGFTNVITIKFNLDEKIDKSYFLYYY